MLIGIICLVFVNTTNAQERPNHIISGGTTNLGPGTASLGYEGVINDSFSWTVRGLYLSNYTSGDWKFSANGAGISLKSFFSSNAPVGGYSYIGLDALNISAEYTYKQTTLTYYGWPYYSYQYVTTTKTDTGSGLLYGPKAGLGYQSLWGALSTDIGIGGAYYSGDFKIAGQKLALSNVAVADFFVSIGYAW